MSESPTPTHIQAPEPDPSGHPIIMELLDSYGSLNMLTDERQNIPGGVAELVKIDTPKGRIYAQLKWHNQANNNDIVPLEKQADESFINNGFASYNKYSLLDLTSSGIAPVARAFGIDAGTFYQLQDHKDETVEVWTIPSPEYENSVAQNVFERQPNNGFPLLATFVDGEGDGGELTALQFFREVDAGRLPVVDVTKPDLLAHDILGHFSYNFLPTNFFQDFQSACRRELAKDYDWSHLNYSKDPAGALLMGFDALTGQLSGIFLGHYKVGEDKDNLASLVDYFSKIVEALHPDINPNRKETKAIEYGEATLAEIERMRNIAVNQQPDQLAA